MTMRSISPARALLCAAAALALSACGHADSANDAASADNVEIPAEEAMSGLPPSAVPVAAGADSADVAVSADSAGQ
jgi:hypothetical protein